MLVSSFYSSILAIIFIVLTVRVIKLRRSNKIAIGDGNNIALQKAIRAQGNFSETVPLSLILLVIAENNGASLFWLNFCAVILVIGRISHGYGVSQISENYRFRVFGMTMTFASISLLSLVNIVLSLKI